MRGSGISGSGFFGSGSRRSRPSQFGAGHVVSSLFDRFLGSAELPVQDGSDYQTVSLNDIGLASTTQFEDWYGLSGELSFVGAEDSYQSLVALENSGEHFRKRLEQSLERLVLEAMEFAAREVYIGHPREYCYEFFVEDFAYQGKLSPSDYFSLLKLFGEEGEDLELPSDLPEVESIRLSLTNNNLNPVIHLSWRLRWQSTEHSQLPF